MIRTSLEGLEGQQIDTLIVGSGPAGLTLAMELSRLGLDSLVLESGGHAPGPAQDLSAVSVFDPRRHDDMSIAVARRLGGTSNLWGGRSMPFDPVDFQPRRFALQRRWPIAYSDLAPYYAAACRYTHCGEPVFDLPLPGTHAASDEFSFTSIERASNKPRFQMGHKARLASDPRIDIRLGATVVELLLAENGSVRGVVAVGDDRVRRTLSARRVVIAAGGLESTRLLLATQRGRERLFGGPDGPLGRYYMGHIIGEIGDIVFRDGRLAAAFDFILDGRGSYARRRFVPSPALQLAEGLPNVCFWPVVPPVADARHGSGSLSAVAMALSTPMLGRMLVPEAIRTRHVPEEIHWMPHMRNVAVDLPNTMSFLGGFLWKRYLASQRIPGYFVRNPGHRYGLSYHSEQSPRDDSRVILGRKCDALGLPRLEIDLRFHREDAEALVRAHERLRGWLTASGFGDLEYRQPAAENVEAVLEQAAHGTHQIGTARMGFDRHDGVVDGELRCFDSPNLFVASSAVFPTSSQANPTLTIVALAVRLAATLAAESVASALISSPPGPARMPAA